MSMTFRYCRYDEYCQLTCGYCSARPSLAPSGPTFPPTDSFPPTTYEPSLSPSDYCGDNSFKSAFPMVCFVFASSSACCRSYTSGKGCDKGGVFAPGGECDNMFDTTMCHLFSDLSGQYSGYCARSCLYCGPTPTPTLIPPTPFPSTLKPSTSQVPTAVCNDGFLLRDAKDFLRADSDLPELCATSISRRKDREALF